MLVVAGLITLVGLGVALYMSQRGTDAPGWATAAVSGLAAPFVLGIVFIRFTYWTTISNGVEVTERQLPEVHAVYADLVREMEMDTTPRLYVKNGNGGLDAFASECTLRKAYVTIFSDLVDLAYENGDLEAIRFVLPHELGHIKCGHGSVWRSAIASVPRLLFLNRSVTRAQEYTADRCGAYYAPQGAKQMIALFAGKRVYRLVDLDEYFQHASR